METGVVVSDPRARSASRSLSVGQEGTSIVRALGIREAGADTRDSKGGAIGGGDVGLICGGIKTIKQTIALQKCKRNPCTSTADDMVPAVFFYAKSNAEWLPCSIAGQCTFVAS